MNGRSETSLGVRLCVASTCLFVLALILGISYVVFAPKSVDNRAASFLRNRQQMFEETELPALSFMEIVAVALNIPSATENVAAGWREPREGVLKEDFDFRSRFPLGGAPQKVYRGQHLVETGVLRPMTAKLSVRGRGISSDDVVSGRVGVVQTLRPGRPNTVTDDVIAQQSECSLRKNSSHAPRVVLCTIVQPFQEALAIEWVQWHRILGVDQFHLFVPSPGAGRAKDREQHHPDLNARAGSDDAILASCTIEKLAHLLEKEIANKIVVGHSLDGLHGASVELEAVRRCAEKAGDDAFVGFSAPSEFLVLPQGHCVADLVAHLRSNDTEDATPKNTSSRALDGVAVVKTEVSHKGELKDLHRTQLERTMFGMGVPPHQVAFMRRTPGLELFILFRCTALVSFLGGFQHNQGLDQRGPRLALLHVSPGSGELIPTDSALNMIPMTSFKCTDPQKPVSTIFYPLPPKRSDGELAAVMNASRVLSYKVRALSAHILQTLVEGNPSQRFDLTMLKVRWEKRRGVGRSDLRFYNPKLKSQHHILLQSLGYSQLSRRVRARGAPGGVEGEEAESMAPIFGLDPHNATQLDSLLTHQNIAQEANGVRVVQENVIHTLKAEHVSIPLESECSRRNSVLPTLKGPHAKEIVFCTYVRNRAKLTVEWIQWHRILGVSRFYVFDDDSSDKLRQDLKVFVDTGVVIYRQAPQPPYRFIHFPVAGGMLDAYGQCAEEEASNKTWVGFFDSDEFISLPRESDCLQDIVAGAVKKNANVGSVAFPWKHVGHMGEMVDKSRTQFERTHFSDGTHDPTERIKCIARADLAYGMETAHKVFLWSPFVTGTVTGHEVRGEGWWSNLGHRHPVFERSFVLHYHVRSAASWIQKQVDGFADNDDRIFEEDVWEFRVNVWFDRWREEHKEPHPQRAIPSHLRTRHNILLRSLGYPSRTKFLLE